MCSLRDRGVLAGEKHKVRTVSGILWSPFSLVTTPNLPQDRHDTVNGRDRMADPGSRFLLVLSRLQCPVLLVSRLLPGEKLDSFQKIKSRTASENQLHQEEIAQAIPLVCL